MEAKKKVYVLYRVTNKRQSDVAAKNISKQEKACRDFAKTHPNWEIIKEIYEIGVSGYKTPIKKRKAPIEIIQDAENNKYDILLILCADRLSRKKADYNNILSKLN